MSDTFIEKAKELTVAISGQIDGHLFDSIVALFHDGILEHRVLMPQSSYDPKKQTLTLTSGNGVFFTGREKILKQANQIKELESKLKIAAEALRFYADQENWHWSYDEGFMISIEDIFTRPINGREIESGGKTAKEALIKIEGDNVSS